MKITLEFLAAYAAADAAADARKEIQLKILNYGLNLVKNEGKLI